MKTKWNTSFVLKGALTLVYFVCVLGCSTSTVDPDFIPSIGAFWTDGDNNGNNNTHSITWQYAPFGCPTPAPCRNEGFFTGTGSYRKDGKIFSCYLAGSFKNHHIEWFYPESTTSNTTCPIRGASFSGTINDASDKITASSPTLGELVLQKH